MRCQTLVSFLVRVTYLQRIFSNKFCILGPGSTSFFVRVHWIEFEDTAGDRGDGRLNGALMMRRRQQQLEVGWPAQETECDCVVTDIGGQR